MSQLHTPPTKTYDFNAADGEVLLSVEGPFGMPKRTFARYLDGVYFISDNEHVENAPVGISALISGKRLFVSVHMTDIDSDDYAAFAIVTLRDNISSNEYKQELSVEQYDSVVFRFLISIQ